MGGTDFVGSKAATRIFNAAMLIFYSTNLVFLFGEILTQISNEFNYVFDILSRRAKEAGTQLARSLLASAMSESARTAAIALPEDDDNAMPASEDVVRRPRPVTLV